MNSIGFSYFLRTSTFDLLFFDIANFVSLYNCWYFNIMKYFKTISLLFCEEFPWSSPNVSKSVKICLYNGFTIIKVIIFVDHTS